METPLRTFTFAVLCALAPFRAVPLSAADNTAAITAVASLTDPAKLGTLKTARAANDRLHKIMAWMEEARRSGMVPSKTIDEAQKITGDTGAHGVAVKEALLRNFEYAQRAALFTPENLALMKSGRSPRVPSGTFQGQPYEVDHIIPIARFPQLGNELANLIYLPRTQNRRKSDDIKQRAIELGQRLVMAGIFSADDFARLKELRSW